MSRFEQSKQADARAAQIAAKAEALKQWLADKHPDIPYSEAVKRAFMEDMGDAFLVATSEDFEYSLNTSATEFVRQRVPTPEEVVAAENKHRKRLSLPELQQLARDENPAPQRTALPNEFFGYDVSTPKALKTLAKNNVTAFRALCNRYGTDKVNERLGVAAPKQVGRSITLNI